jgi:hypothetical protein
MKRSLQGRVCTVLATALLITLALAAPALAAPPSNDSITSATRLGAPPARFDVDTRQATASSTDGGCVFGRSVWFRIRPTVTRSVRLTTLGSDYDTVLTVFRGTSTNRTRIACVDDDAFEDAGTEAAQVRFVAGKQYWVAVSSCCRRTAGGGHLELSTYLPTAAGVTTTIDSVESGAVSGRLLVHGTVQCDTPSVMDLDLSASQRVGAGANVASGDGEVFDVCGPQESNWTARVDSRTGWAFQPGTTSVTLTGVVYDGFGLVEAGPQTDNFDVTDNPNGFAP